MADRRIVDELSIEELERILAIKKRQARQSQLQRMKRSGRVITPPVMPPQPPPITPISNANGWPAQTISVPDSSVRYVASTPQFADERVSVLHDNDDEDNRIWHKFVDRFLLLIEVVSVVGLIALGGTMLNNIGLLQQTTANVQAEAEAHRRESIPTIEPTPQLQLANIVLPSGHIPPTELGGGQFNFDEIPANLRSQVRDQVFLSPEIERPPITTETPLRIIIPDINVDNVIVQGVDWEALKLGVGQLSDGTTPTDANGNIVLAAHNDIYGEIFRHLDQLKPGMNIQIQTQSAYHTYVVRETRIVMPDEVSVLQSQNRAIATLISCYPYQVDSKRIVVFADKLD